MKIIKIVVLSLCVVVPSFSMQQRGTWHTVKVKTLTTANAVMQAPLVQFAYGCYCKFDELTGSTYIPYSELLAGVDTSVLVGAAAAGTAMLGGVYAYLVRQQRQAV